MSIEKSSPSPHAKAVTGSDTHGKKAGKAPDASGSSGFSALMNMLSAAEEVAVVPAAGSLLAEVPLDGQTGTQSEVNVRVDGPGLIAVALPAVTLMSAVESDIAASVASILVSALPLMETSVSPTSTAVLFAPVPVPVSPTASTASTASKASTSTTASTASTASPRLTTSTSTSTSTPPALLSAFATQPVSESEALSAPSEATQSLVLPAPQVALLPAQSMQSANAQLGAAVGAGSTINVSAVPSQLVDLALPQPIADSVGEPVKVDREFPLPLVDSNNTPNKLGKQASPSDTGELQKATLVSTPSDALSASAAGGQTTADVAQTATVNAFLAQKNVVRQAFSAAQQDFKEVKASASSLSVMPAADASFPLLAGAVIDFVRPQGRFGARPGLGQSGSSGFESAFGQAMAATHRSDAVFEVPPASAVVADTAVAETVSYWASQGVQTAELELEGFGDSPVEVSIVLNGDQAQIDFRTDQAGVRQVLEAATAQLKELLSNQGLQLSGVSVGTSGKGSEQGNERRARQGAQQATLVKTEAVGSTRTRTANPAVGRSLDLFV